jgi:glycosyltransferase involved in cell wall biosynthesis
MKFSIIVPTYNSERWIPSFLSSILAQTYQSFDVIILDSGSTDNTMNIIRAVDDTRIRIYPSATRLGIAENWGRICNIPKNEYMTIMGHDDIFYPDFLDIIKSLIEQHPNAGVYHTHFDFIDAKGKLIRKCSPMKTKYEGNELLQGLLTRRIDAMATGYVVKSKDYDATGGIPVKYPNLLFADYALWLNLSYNSYEAVAPQTCFAFRVHQSVTNTTSDDKLHMALACFIDYLAEAKKNRPGADKIIDQYAASFLLAYTTSYSHRLLRTALHLRENIRVDNFVAETKKHAAKLGVGTSYLPEKAMKIKAASLIDSNALLRTLFLFFRRLYPKPLFNE